MWRSRKSGLKAAGEIAALAVLSALLTGTLYLVTQSAQPSRAALQPRGIADPGDVSRPVRGAGEENVAPVAITPPDPVEGTPLTPTLPAPDRAAADPGEPGSRDILGRDARPPGPSATVSPPFDPPSDVAPPGPDMPPGTAAPSPAEGRDARSRRVPHRSGPGPSRGAPGLRGSPVNGDPAAAQPRAEAAGPPPAEASGPPPVDKKMCWTLWRSGCAVGGACPLDPGFAPCGSP